jgi:hypothetical protein
MAQFAIAPAPAWTSTQVVTVAGNIHGIITTLGNKVYKGKTLGEHASENPAVLKTWAAARGTTLESQERKSFAKILIDSLEASQLMTMPPIMPVPPSTVVVQPPALASSTVSVPPTSDSHHRRRLITLPVHIPTPSVEMAKAAVSTMGKNPGLSLCCLMFAIIVTLYDAGLWVVVPCRMVCCIPRFFVWFADRLCTRAEQELFGYNAAPSTSTGQSGANPYQPQAFHNNVGLYGWLLAAFAIFRRN